MSEHRKDNLGFDELTSEANALHAARKTAAPESTGIFRNHDGNYAKTFQRRRIPTKTIN